MTKLETYSFNLSQNIYRELSKWEGKIIRNQVYTSKQLQADVQELTDDILSFMEYLLKTGLVEDKDFGRVYERICKNVKSADFLPENKRGIFGEYISDEQRVYINPNLNRGKRRLYTYHELGHACFKDTKYAPFIGGISRHSTVYGYMVIEEALAQNIAETCYYASINKTRPAKHSSSETFLPNIQFQTNYDYYGLYQPLAVAFGRVLRGVGTSPLDSDDKILFELSKKALREDLLESVIKEYQEDGIEQDLGPMFFALANVYAAKKASFGLGGVVERAYDINATLLAEKTLLPAPREAKMHYQKALEIMKRNENYRAPRENF